MIFKAAVGVKGDVIRPEETKNTPTAMSECVPRITVPA
jgi:hypothetical protein